MATSKSTTNRTVAYYRRSTTHQEASLTEQRDWCKGAATRERLDVVAEFSDDGISGSEVERRPGLMAMVAYCQQQHKAGRPIELILCWDADRLSRASSVRTAAVLDDLMGAGVTRLFTSEGWVDLEDDCDLLLFNAKQDLGRSAYAKSIAKNITRSALDRARQGLWVCGKPPYGYAIGPDRKLVIVEDEAVVVRRLFARILAGDSLGELARVMNTAKEPPPGHGQKRKDPEFKAGWRRDTIHRILRNPNYVGDLVWNRVRQGKHQRVTGGKQEKVTGQRGEKVWSRNAAEDVIVTTDAHPHIIDRETFAAVEAKLKESRWKRTAPTLSGEWIFSGLIRCGDCGAKMYGRNHRHRRKEGLVYRRYFCSNNASSGKGGACRMNGASQDFILAAVLKELKAIYADPSRLTRLIEAVTLTRADAEAETVAALKRIDAELTALDAKVRQAEENMVCAPKHQLPVFSRILDGFNEQHKELLATRVSLVEGARIVEADACEIRDALGCLADLGDDLQDVPPREARRVVERLVAKVTVVFDHDRPHNVSHAAYIDLEFRPDVTKLVACKVRQATSLVVRLPLES